MGLMESIKWTNDNHKFSGPNPVARINLSVHWSLSVVLNQDFYNTWKIIVCQFMALIFIGQIPNNINKRIM